MPHTDEFYRWRGHVQGLFPEVQEHHRRAPAEYSFALALARRCGLTSVVAYLATFLAHQFQRHLARTTGQPTAAQSRHQAQHGHRRDRSRTPCTPPVTRTLRTPTPLHAEPPHTHHSKLSKRHTYCPHKVYTT